MSFSYGDVQRFDESRAKLSRYQRLKSTMFDVLYNGVSAFVPAAAPSPLVSDPVLRSVGATKEPVLDEYTARQNNKAAADDLFKRIAKSAEDDRRALEAEQAAREAAAAQEALEAAAAARLIKVSTFDEIKAKIEKNLTGIDDFNQRFANVPSRSMDRIRFNESATSTIVMQNAKVASLSDVELTIEFGGVKSNYPVSKALLILLFYSGENAVKGLKKEEPSLDDIINFVDIVRRSDFTHTLTQSMGQIAPGRRNATNNRFVYLRSVLAGDELLALNSLNDFPAFKFGTTLYNPFFEQKIGKGLRKKKREAKPIGRTSNGTLERATLLVGQLRAGNNNPRILAELRELMK